MAHINDPIIKSIFSLNNDIKNLLFIYKENIDCKIIKKIELPDKYEILIDFYDMTTINKDKIDISFYYKNEELAFKKLRRENKIKEINLINYVDKIGPIDDKKKIINEFLEYYLLKDLNIHFDTDKKTSSSFMKFLEIYKKNKIKNFIKEVGNANLKNLNLVMRYRNEILKKENLSITVDDIFIDLRKNPIIIKNKNDVKDLRDFYEIKIYLINSPNFVDISFYNCKVSIPMATIKKALKELNYDYYKGSIGQNKKYFIKQLNKKEKIENFFKSKEFDGNKNISLDNFYMKNKNNISYLYNTNKNLLLKRSIYGDININFQKDIEDNEEVLYSIDLFIKEYFKNKIYL